MKMNEQNEATNEVAAAGAGGPAGQEEVPPQQELEVVESFDDMELRDEILRGIYSIGFEEPSPIQKVAIKAFASGRDLIAQAQSGTGKTGAFSIATLQKLDPTVRRTQAVILSPTRELADQTNQVITQIGEYNNISSMLAIGGVQLSQNIQSLKDGAQVVIGTPGRVIDLCQRGYLKMGEVHTLIIDEADEMLAEGFKEQVRVLFGFLNENCQIGLFSATMDPEVVELTKHFMRSPNRILMNKEMVTLDGIVQYYVYCEQDANKFAVIDDLYNRLNSAQTIIFCNSKQRVKDLESFLKERQHSTCVIHGDMDTQERRDVIKHFRTGGSRILIASDLVARGIDIQGIGCTINFDIPYKFPNYIHRIGRAGRFGRKGVTINLTTKKSQETLQKLENYWSCQIRRLPGNFEEEFKRILG
jgi:translation initiation factor 4A